MMKIYGTHACTAAIQNPKRCIKNIWLSEGQMPVISKLLHKKHPKPVLTQGKDLDKRAGHDAVHQGAVMEVEPLNWPELYELEGYGSQPIVMLDQVTDPHNVGAILRSAAAFGAIAVVMQQRHSAPITGVLAKAACGALESVAVKEVVNLSMTLKELKSDGYWAAGLAGEADTTFREAKLNRNSVLVLGAEGAGLRRLVAENCDTLVKLPMSPKMESLNVSNAAAIGLYELYHSATI